MNALFNLLVALVDLSSGEVLVAGVHRLESAAVDGNQGLAKELQIPSQDDEPPADVPNAGAVVASEVCDRLGVRCEAPGEPHLLDVALALPFESAARLHPIQVAIDVDLQKIGGVVQGATARPARHLRSQAASDPTRR